MCIFILDSVYDLIVIRSILRVSGHNLFSIDILSFPFSSNVFLDRTWFVLDNVFYFFFFLVATFIAFPFLSGLGSSRRFLLAALALFFLPNACALACGKHLGLPSESLPLAQGPLIFPSGPNLTHFCLNHFLRSSVMNSCARIYLLLLLPQLLAPTFLHFASAPEAYAEGQTRYRDFTLW